jgi:hypothetical protein
MQGYASAQRMAEVKTKVLRMTFMKQRAYHRALCQMIKKFRGCRDRSPSITA